ncbi:MAG TPA: bifunctional riboflavin kinase/FAD synthetase [Fimbriimonadales bacterium]|nr:bifunctional riboflavin kinase/FAD synthetase [Fimbriimonadales bacterium]
MITIYGLETLTASWNESTVSIGVFDGVHLGHQAVIRRACEDAKNHQRPCIVLTFDRHPLSVLRPEHCPPTILPPDLKIRKIEKLGVDILVIVRFDKEFASQSPEQFFENVLRSRLRAGTVVVGHDFAFGKDRTGDVNWLKEKIDTIAVPPETYEGQRVSSTNIRKKIAEGDVKGASILLGSPYGISGIVVQGSGLGKELGIPTLNIVPVVEQILPRYGIYAGYAETSYGKFQAALSIGERPTVGTGFAIEAHLLDFPPQNLYGHLAVLFFVERLREEEKFLSVDELRMQMQRDIEQVRAVLR